MVRVGDRDEGADEGRRQQGSDPGGAPPEPAVQGASSRAVPMLRWRTPSAGYWAGRWRARGPGARRAGLGLAGAALAGVVRGRLDAIVAKPELAMDDNQAILPLDAYRRR